MNYIYHLKPTPFEGTCLIPLNSMDQKSALYQRHAQKYSGRETLMDTIIPKLNCKWNDVVQFSAIDPQIILQKLKEINSDFQVSNLEYFKVPIEDLVVKYEVALFCRKAPKTKGDFTIDENDIKLLVQNAYIEPKNIPEATINYWHEVKKAKGNPLWFPYVPHVFVKGIIETSRFEVCSLNLN